MSQQTIQIGDSGGLLISKLANNFNELYNGGYMFSPQNYGGVADYNVVTKTGTDISEALQDAIDAISSLGGGIVNIPQGNYLIESEITLKNNVKIKGVGIDITKLYCGTNSINMFYAQAISDWGIEGITFSTVDNTNVVGLAILDSVSMNLDHVKFTGIKNGILFDSLDVNPLTASAIVHGRVSGCYFSANTGASVHSTAMGAMWNLKFDSTRFETTKSSHFISVPNVSVAKGMTGFYNCIFESSEANKALDLGWACNFRFYDCHFENNGVGISSGTIYDVWFDENSRSISFINNLFCNMPYNESVRKYHICLSNSTTDVTIMGNEYYCQSTVLSCVHVGTSCQNITLINNYYGLNLTNGSDLFLELLSPVTRINDGQARLQQGLVYDNIPAFIVTTDETQTKLFTYTLPNLRMAVYIIADVIATSFHDVGKAAYTRKALVYSNDTGINVIASVSEDTTIESDATWDCTISKSGTNKIDVLVTGIAATEITWVGSIKILVSEWDR